jgi:hypothetical protein
MTLSKRLLDELTEALARVLAHELEAFDEVKDAETRAKSVAGNTVMVWCEPIERFGRACVIAALSGASRALVREGATIEDLGAMQCRRKP